MMMSRREALAAAAGTAAIVAAGPGAAAPPRPKPLVFAHRGCSALRPEHTLGAYAKAIEDGADFIEPDCVATKDGAIVVRHENNIAETTDIAAHPEFAARKAVRRIDGEEQSGWFTEDFTLAELKTLRAVERLGTVRPESRSYDGHFQILTLDEVIDFTAAEAAARGRTIGLVPEIKHSTYFAGIGLPLEDRLLAVLAAHAYTRRAPVEIQSFETANLRSLHGKLADRGNVKLLQLIGDPRMAPADGGTTYGAMLTPAGLRGVAAYAQVMGPPTQLLIGPDGKPTGLIAAAHAAGLLVRPWTFRPENRFLPADLRSDAGENARNEAGSITEIRRHLAAGIDGFFTDDPALGRRAVDG